MEIIDGKNLANQIKNEIKEEIYTNYTLKNKKAPTLACILVGDNPASKVYVANKEKACNAVGMNSLIIKLPETATNEDVISEVKRLNNDASISGILVQLPLPKGLDESRIINTISPNKDVDALTTASLGKLFAGNQIVAPCTSSGIIKMLDAYNVDIAGKNVVVIGRSLLAGKSVAELLLKRNATVTICHSKTENLASHTKNADILIVAVGKPKFITADMIKPNSTVIDVGINRLETGLVGDVDFDSAKNVCKYITPVPGGVGPMTIAMLLQNTLVLHKYMEKYSCKQNDICK